MTDDCFFKFLDLKSLSEEDLVAYQMPEKLISHISDLLNFEKKPTASKPQKVEEETTQDGLWFTGVPITSFEDDFVPMFEVKTKFTFGKLKPAECDPTCSEVILAILSETLQSNSKSNEYWKANKNHKLFTEK